MAACYLLLVLSLPLVLGPFALFLHGKRQRWLRGLAYGCPVTCAFLIFLLGGELGWKGQRVLEFPFVPALGVNFSFVVDGLSLFFGLLVTLMGVLVFHYTYYYYYDKPQYHPRLFGGLIFFMGSMLGCVFSDNLLLLFIFWELTGVASFLLIGFFGNNQEARRGARAAMLVTTVTGLALLVGIIMVYLATGTYQWSELTAQGLDFGLQAGWLNAALVLMMVGAFGKSAQFPFHFWLPGAMAAPTPVSSYLHSATMVKLGVFLTARLYPLFVGADLWFPVTTTICFGTMLLGGMLALLSNDLKAILAYATLSQLGFFIGFYGLGHADGVRYDFLHILNHSLYKGSLFMLVGIVDHATGIRDIRRLGHLGAIMPLTAVSFLVAAGAMAGLPGSTGFLSKELMINDLIQMSEGRAEAYVVLMVVAFTSIFKVAFSLRLFYHIFLGKAPTEIPPIHSPGLAVHISPLVLSGAALFFGLWPKGLDSLSDFFFVSGLHRPAPMDLAIWHGWRLELLISLSIIVLGVLTFVAAERAKWRFASIPNRLRFHEYFEGHHSGLLRLSKKVTRWTQPRYLRYMLGAILLFFSCGVAWLLIAKTRPWPPISSYFHWHWDAAAFMSGFVVLFVVVALFNLFHLMLWSARLIALGIVGLVLTIFYVLYRAPDLGLTQLLVEAFMFMLMLLMLRRMPEKGVTSVDPLWWRVVRPSVASGFGLVMGCLMVYAQGVGSESRVGSYYLEKAGSMVGGANVVNAILVDFRGFDTLGEIMVLATGALGCVALLNRHFYRWQG